MKMKKLHPWAIYEGVAYCAMSQFVTLEANGKTLKFWFYVIREYYEKLVHMLKPLLPKFRPDLSTRLKHIAEKQVPAKLKPIVTSEMHAAQKLLQHV